VRKSTTNFLDVIFYPTKAEIWKYDGSWTMLHQNTGVSTATGTLYDVRVLLDGANMKVLRSTGGGLETTVFNVGSMPTYDGTRMQFIVNTNMVASLDNIMVMADDLNRQTTYTYQNNNELSGKIGTATYFLRVGGLCFLGRPMGSARSRWPSRRSSLLRNESLPNGRPVWVWPRNVDWMYLSSGRVKVSFQLRPALISRHQFKSSIPVVSS